VTNFTYSGAALETLQKSDPDVFYALINEEVRQSEGIELIPSENYCFPEVYALLGSVFNNTATAAVGPRPGVHHRDNV
jgi:glycine/serine hydroxymethyltransferase